MQRVRVRKQIAVPRQLGSEGLNSSVLGCTVVEIFLSRLNMYIHLCRS